MRLLLVAATLTLASIPARAEEIRFPVDGASRRAYVYAPAITPPPSGFPVVLAFHGRGDAIQNFEFVNIHGGWPQAIVVYLQALNRDGYPGWQVTRGQDADRDLKMVDAAMSMLRSKYRVDDRRVYAVGFSNGAGFSLLLWAERPNLFAGFGIVAGRWNPDAQPRVRKPAIIISGINDSGYADHRAGMEQALALNGVGTTGTPCGDGCQRFGARSQTPVVTITHPGDHEFVEPHVAAVVSFLKEVASQP